MFNSKASNPSAVDFWVDYDRYSNRINGSAFNTDLIKLASIRKSISNFVRILTKKNIPVYFNDDKKNVNFGGKTIYISSFIYTKFDFEASIGQALHEAAHTVKSDFDVVKSCWQNIPHHIFKLSDSKNIRRSSIEKFIHTICNVIEDRYIDDYVFRIAPGYRGYYVSLYNKFWNSVEIDEYLISDLFRYSSLESYRFRITNLTNINTDLLALPRLDEIAELIDLTTINRLKRTQDRIELAFKITEIVLDCIEIPIPDADANAVQTKLADPSDFFGEDESDESTPNTGSSSNNSSNEENEEPEKDEDESTDKKSDSIKDVDVGKKAIEELSEILKGNQNEPDENKDLVNKISDEDIDPNVEKQIEKIIEKQTNFFRGEFPPGDLTAEEKKILDIIEKNGIILVQANVPTIIAGDPTNIKINCIVVQKMTMELVLAGSDIFPLSSTIKIGNNQVEPSPKGKDCVHEGISIGTKLGRRLQIRNEVNELKLLRKKHGKINKRNLYTASFDAEDLFYKIKKDNYSIANLHITVDASSSMTGNKWYKSMTAVVAICKAASMVDNIHVTVSFRATHLAGSTILPYIVIAYDSKQDKFSKIQKMFPFLVPNGWTPEGLAFEAISQIFNNMSTDETDRYFLNLSDGEPCFAMSIQNTSDQLNYVDEVGVNHTKSQVDKIRKKDINIMSYFISDDEVDEHLKNNFIKMYGEDAKFIHPTELSDLAKTLNQLFLQKKTMD